MMPPGKRQHHKETTTPPCELIQRQIPQKLMKKLTGGGKLLSPGKWKPPFGSHTDILHVFFTGILRHLEAPPSPLFFIYKA